MAFELIKEVVKGDRSYTALLTTLINRIIRGVNAAMQLEFLPTGIARVDFGKKITVTWIDRSNPPDNPYIMGSTAGGSITGGGSGDTPPSGESAFTDTWDINAPPLDINNHITDGVKWEGTREHSTGEGGGSYRLFTRNCTYNKKGHLTFIDHEIQILGP